MEFVANEKLSNDSQGSAELIANRLQVLIKLFTKSSSTKRTRSLDLSAQSSEYHISQKKKILQLFKKFRESFELECQDSLTGRRQLSFDAVPRALDSFDETLSESSFL